MNISSDSIVIISSHMYDDSISYLEKKTSVNIYLFYSKY